MWSRRYKQRLLKWSGVVILCLGFSLGSRAQDTLFVLAVGNSFSWDAVEQELNPMLHEVGKEAVIGNLYYGGCSLQQHVDFFRKDTAAYSLRIIDKDGRHVTEGVRLREALAKHKWHYVSLQQASHDSGEWGSFEPALDELVTIVENACPEAQLLWMQTWSYAKDAKHPAFPRYGMSQSRMDDSIRACTRRVLLTYPRMRLVPCGEAIRLARLRLGDTLCRDGYHLNYRYGRYTASCVWLEVLTGRNCCHLRYKNPEMSRKEQFLTQKSAHRAKKCTFLRKNAKK